MTELMNELINDEAVYRTTPATPGLLIIVLGMGANIRTKMECFVH